MGMLLIVGLGNPGAQYANNRHNIGFQVIDAIQKTYKLPDFAFKFQGHMTSGEIKGQKVILLKPLTYMNLSGQSVGDCARFYKIPLEDIIVVHDDIDLNFAKIKAKQGGGHGGHNGLKSIDAHLGQDYWRIRFGVGRPKQDQPASAHVLRDFSKDEEAEVDHLVYMIIDELPALMEKNADAFMAGIYRRQQQILKR